MAMAERSKDLLKAGNGRSEYAHSEETVSAVEEQTQATTTATSPPFFMSGVERDGSFLVLCSTYHTLWSWSEISQERSCAKTE